MIRRNPILIFGLILLAFSIGSSACKSPGKELTTFSGDKSSIEKADQMFDAIGGKDAWCELRSLYIKAEHTEPQMTIPYQSEIWRGIDKFELVIEQQNDSFHVKGIITSEGGEVHYLDKRDTTRILTDTQLKDWEFDHGHNVYVLLHDLGCNPENYRVEIDKDQRLAFYRDDVYLVSFELDDKSRPYLFYRPNPDGSVSGSIFTHWGTHDGLVHSAGGHPLDSNFVYRTEIWQPSKKPLGESFGGQVLEF